MKDAKLSSGRRLGIALALAALGFLMAAVYGSMLELECTRDGQETLSCSTLVTDFGRLPLGRHKTLTGIHTIAVEEHIVRDFDQTSEAYGLIFFTPQEQYHLSSHYFTRDTAFQAAQQLNDLREGRLAQAVVVGQYFNPALMALGLVCGALTFLGLSGLCLYAAVADLANQAPSDQGLGVPVTASPARKPAHSTTKPGR